MAYEKLKATASVTIIDETDASTLVGNMVVVKGSKNQIYITGQDNPYSPDWTKNNLVIRPFLQASNITKTNKANEEYNPDLFDPAEYPQDLITYGYISNIHWFLRDSAGVEEELLDHSAGGFAYTYTTDSATVLCADCRQLIINQNILAKNSTADIICRFSFYDPFANIFIQQQIETTIINIASGQSNSRLVTTCVNGNAISNSGEQYIDIIAKFYDDTGEQDIGELINDGLANVSCLWYIRRHDGWVLLDPTEDGQTNANIEALMYNIMKVNSYNETSGAYELEQTYNAKGGTALRIYPAAITGSEVIKCVVTDPSAARFNSLQVVYDTTDTTTVELHCSNGRRLKKGSVEDTTIKAVVTYKGALLEEDSPLYMTEFDYYWYKYTLVDDVYVNVYNDAMNNLMENPDLENPIKGSRSLYINTFAIDSTEKEARFSLDLVEFGALSKDAAQANYYATAISEEDLAAAMVVNCTIGMDPNDIAAAICTAQELNALDE